MNPEQLKQQEQILLRRRQALVEKKNKIGTKKNRIGFGVDLMMKCLALLLDIIGASLELIPFLGGFIASLIGVVGDMCIMFAYALLRVKQVSTQVKGNKTLAVRIGCMLLELIPFVNILPAFSIAVWYTNGVVHKEDREYNRSIESSLKEIQQEEQQLQRDTQQFQAVVQQYQETEYNNEQYEAAEQNQVHDEDEQDSIAA